MTFLDIFLTVLTILTMKFTYVCMDVHIQHISKTDTFKITKFCI